VNKNRRVFLLVFLCVFAPAIFFTDRRFFHAFFTRCPVVFHTFSPSGFTQPVFFASHPFCTQYSHMHIGPNKMDNTKHMQAWLSNRGAPSIPACISSPPGGAPRKANGPTQPNNWNMSIRCAYFVNLFCGYSRVRYFNIKCVVFERAAFFFSPGSSVVAPSLTIQGVPYQFARIFRVYPIHLPAYSVCTLSICPHIQGVPYPFARIFFLVSYQFARIFRVYPIHLSAYLVYPINLPAYEGYQFVRIFRRPPP